MKLQVGEKYRRSDGEIRKIIRKFDDHMFKFKDEKGGSYTENGCYASTPTSFDLIEHITTEDKMNETFIAVKVTNPMVYGLHVTLAEAERLGEEAKRIKAENEINAGDWFMDKCDKAIRMCIKNSMGRLWYCCGGIEDWMHESNCIKITNPAHIQALKEIYEGMK